MTKYPNRRNNTTYQYGDALKGEELPQSKLNATLVRLIRAEHANKESAKRDLDAKHSAAAIARRYGMSKQSIDKVITFQTWRHVR